MTDERTMHIEDGFYSASSAKLDPATEAVCRMLATRPQLTVSVKKLVRSDLGQGRFGDHSHWRPASAATSRARCASAVPPCRGPTGRACKR